MRQDSEPYIVPEGYPFIGLAAWCAVLCGILQWKAGAVAFWVLTVGIAAFFRNPARRTPEDDNALVSPADGRVLGVDKLQASDFIEGPTWKISIFMSVFNVHVNRVPVSGTVAWKRSRQGRFLVASRREASSQNERVEVCIRARPDTPVGVVQVAGWVARRIVCYPEKGDVVVRGARLGMIRFGSRLEVYVPEAARVVVRPGETVRAGETIIGYLP